MNHWPLGLHRIYEAFYIKQFRCPSTCLEMYPPLALFGIVCLETKDVTSAKDVTGKPWPGRLLINAGDFCLWGQFSSRVWDAANQSGVWHSTDTNSDSQLWQHLHSLCISITHIPYPSPAPLCIYNDAKGLTAMTDSDHFSASHAPRSLYHFRSSQVEV